METPETTPEEVTPEEQQEGDGGNDELGGGDEAAGGGDEAAGDQQ